MENNEETNFEDLIAKNRKDIEKLPQYKLLTPQEQKVIQDIGEAHLRKTVDPKTLTKEQIALLDNLFNILSLTN